MGLLGNLGNKARLRADRDHARGVVRIGGRWSYPRYAIGYIKAARAVYDESMRVKGEARRQLVVPCLYLIRHAVELSLKQLLAGLDDIELDRAHFQEQMEFPVTAVRVPPGDLKRMAKTHDLRELLAMLSRNLDATGRGPIPKEWCAFVASLLKLEDEAPDRFRYDEVRWRRPRSGKAKKADRFKRSFPRERPIPIRTLIEGAELMVGDAVDLSEERESASMYLAWDYEARGYVDDLHVNGLL